MRILHVVTLLSPDGAYGGPARVALNQSRELRGRGHDVVVAAATRGYSPVPTELDGVPLALFPARRLIPATGFAGLGAPGLFRWFHRTRTGFDLAHIHLGRDLVVLPVAVTAHRYRIPYVLQTHGMVVPSRHPLAKPLDVVLTRRVLAGAGTVFHLTAQERAQLVAVAGTSLALEQLGNGVPEYPIRDPVANRVPEILFTARLHPRKRPVAFVEMAHRLLGSGVEAKFTLIGPDEGEGAAVRSAIAGDPRIVWEGPAAPGDVAGRLARAEAFVLPAVREPYPMAVLEAMAVGLPVVVTSDCGLAPLIEQTRSGVVVGPDVDELAGAVWNLLADRAAARETGSRGRDAVRGELGMDTIADRLENTYVRLTGSAA